MPENPRANRVPEAPFDVVDAASEQSFPASDPPGWATGQHYRVEPMPASPAPVRRPRRGRNEQEPRPPASQGDEGPGA